MRRATTAIKVQVEFNITRLKNGFHNNQLIVSSVLRYLRQHELPQLYGSATAQRLLLEAAPLDAKLLGDYGTEGRFAFHGCQFLSFHLSQ
jgi:hypothetical protein